MLSHDFSGNVLEKCTYTYDEIPNPVSINFSDLRVIKSIKNVMTFF